MASGAYCTIRSALSRGGVKGGRVVTDSDWPISRKPDEGIALRIDTVGRIRIY